MIQPDAIADERGRISEQQDVLKRYDEWLEEGVAIANDLAELGLGQLGSSNGSAGPKPEIKPPPRSKAKSPARKKKPAAKRSGRPAGSATAKQSDGREVQSRDAAGEARREKLLKYIEEHGPIAPRDLRGPLGYDDGDAGKQRLSQDLTKLAQRKDVQTFGERSARRYNVRGGSITSSNGSGPRTEAERRICEAIEDQPLTVDGIAVKLARPRSEVSSMCEGMVRRGGLEKIDVDDPPIRYRIKT